MENLPELPPVVAVPKKKNKLAQVLGTILVILLIFAAGWGTNWLYQKFYATPKANGPSQENAYLAFTEEVYNTILANYWNKLEESQLTNLFQLATEKLVGQPQSLKETNKKAALKMVENVLDQLPAEKQEEYVAQMADIVLANLEPKGRSRLYTQVEEKQLSQNVQNITEADHYNTIGVEKSASQQEIESNYQQQKTQLETQDSTESAQKLAQLNQAYETVRDPESRQLYDQKGIEPTIKARLIRPNILHLHLTKMSPTTLEELQRVTEKYDQTEGLDTLIFDLRDNIGGSVDLMPYFLGPFIGPDQYAYQFFHQGETTDFKTKTSWMNSLVRYKKVVILINQNTQSSAEVAAATLKKYNVGLLLGAPSKGWGTIEKVFPLQSQISQTNKYSIFLVHSLTLRDDNQPIEGNGVLPLIDLTSSNWQNELYTYLPYSPLIEATQEIWQQQ